MAREMAQRSDLTSEYAPQSSRPAVSNHYHNHRVYNPFHRNLDRWRTGGDNTVSETILPPSTIDSNEANLAHHSEDEAAEYQTYEAENRRLPVSTSPGHGGRPAEKRRTI